MTWRMRHLEALTNVETTAAAKTNYSRLSQQKLVLIDLGNVLIDFDHRRISRELVKHVHPSSNRLVSEIAVHDFIFHNTGAGSRNEMVDRGGDLQSVRRDLCAQFGIEVPEADFRRVWFGIFSPELNKDMLGLVREMRNAGLRVAICSNTNEAHWNPLREAQPALVAAIDEHVLSFEIGRIKTDPDFFDLALARYHDVHREHMVLIDDTLDNCRAAEAAGLHALSFNPANHAQSLGRIRDFLDAHFWMGRA